MRKTQFYRVYHVCILIGFSSIFTKKKQCWNNHLPYQGKGIVTNLLFLYGVRLVILETFEVPDWNVFILDLDVIDYQWLPNYLDKVSEKVNSPLTQSPTMKLPLLNYPSLKLLLYLY